jgi:hypothetical protein
MEGMDDRQKTPRGHPDFNSYVKILRVFIWNGQTDTQTEKLIRCGLGNLIGSSRFIVATYFLAGRVDFATPAFCHL